MIDFNKTAKALNMTIEEYCQYLLHRVGALERELKMDKANFNELQKLCTEKAIDIAFY